MESRISLRSLVAEGLSKRLSVDAGIRKGVLETLPDTVDLGPYETTLRETQERMFLLIQDLSNYGTRKEYIFRCDHPTDREKMEHSWLAGVFGTEVRAEIRALARPVPEKELPETRVRRRSLGECVAHLVRCMSTGSMDFWFLHWLAVDMGYNLDWLFLGVGPMLHFWKDPDLVRKNMPPSRSTYDRKEGRITYEDTSALHERQTMSVWSFTDWQWLFNLRALVRTVYKSPTIPLLARTVAGWRIPQQLPQMPCLASWLDWLVVWCTNEFMLSKDKRRFRGREAWKNDVLTSLVTNRISGALLLGVGVQTTSQYKTARSEPTANVLRLAWIVRMITERRGRAGFLEFLDLLNDEAVNRGFENLGEVFAQKTWSLTPRKQRERGVRRARKTQPTSALVSWGVPEAAKVDAQTLITMIRAGEISVDEDTEVTWRVRGSRRKKV